MDQVRVELRLLEELPPLVTAVAAAEAFFKFHSFTLELLAFGLVLRPLLWAYIRSLRRVHTAR